MEVELQKTYEAIQEGIDDLKKKWEIKKQRSVKRLPHGYYYNPSVREIYQQMVAADNDHSTCFQLNKGQRHNDMTGRQERLLTDK